MGTGGHVGVREPELSTQVPGLRLVSVWELFDHRKTRALTWLFVKKEKDTQEPGKGRPPGVAVSHLQTGTIPSSFVVCREKRRH